MQYRILGRTGERVSEVGFGGADAGLHNYLGRFDLDPLFGRFLKKRQDSDEEMWIAL